MKRPNIEDYIGSKGVIWGSYCNKLEKYCKYLEELIHRAHDESSCSHELNKEIDLIKNMGDYGQ
jgi:hypothetical protein